MASAAVEDETSPMLEVVPKVEKEQRKDAKTGSYGGKGGGKLWAASWIFNYTIPKCIAAGGWWWAFVKGIAATSQPVYVHLLVQSSRQQPASSTGTSDDRQRAFQENFYFPNNAPLLVGFCWYSPAAVAGGG